MRGKGRILRGHYFEIDQPGAGIYGVHEKMNGQEMCMIIAENWLKTDSPNLMSFPGYEKEPVSRLAERIWCYSPGGELFNVVCWYYDIVGYPPGFWDVFPPSLSHSETQTWVKEHTFATDDQVIKAGFYPTSKPMTIAELERRIKEREE